MNFFWILLFGSFVALTERPIDLVAGVNDVPLRVPISAVTHGASIFGVPPASLHELNPQSR